MLGGADKAAAGKHGVEEPRSRLPRTARCSIQERKWRFGAGDVLVGCGDAEAGGSPSSEAPPEETSVTGWTGRKPGAARRRWLCAGRHEVASQGDTAGRRRDRESGSMQGARVESRLQKSERRIFLAGTEARGATRGEPGRAR
jgi:hypothetical protein